MLLSMMLVSCVTHYQVTGITRTRLLVDSHYDVPASGQVAEMMRPYDHLVDSLMSPVLGQAAGYLEVNRPESELTNLFSDILMWSAQFYDEQPDFGIYNKGGIRASLAPGDITKGDVLEMAPFNNYVSFVTLTGEKTMELMQQIAQRGGEGVSKEVRMVISPDNQLKRVTVKGKEIDPQASYRVVTIDYVSHGNDRLTAFKSATDRHDTTGEEDLSSSLIMRYIKDCTAKGRKVDAKIEGRIVVEE